MIIWPAVVSTHPEGGNGVQEYIYMAPHQSATVQIVKGNTVPEPHDSSSSMAGH